MARIEVKSEITGTVWQLKAKPGDKVETSGNPGRLQLERKECSDGAIHRPAVAR